MRTTGLASIALVVLVAAGIVLQQRPAASQSPASTAASVGSDARAVTITFGAKDPEPSKWDGGATISQGEILRIVGHHFDDKARVLPGNRWTCSTNAWGRFSGGMHPNEKPQPFATPNEATGVTIYYRAPDSAELTVTVPSGEFTFRPASVDEKGIVPLRALVEVYPTPAIDKISSEDTEDDYPSTAFDGQRLWVAWQAYRDKSEHVLLRWLENGRWMGPAQATERAGDLFGTAVAPLGGGRAMVVWSEREGANWHLKARAYDGSRFSAVETLTSGAGSNLFHRAASDGKGGVHVAWQSWRGGRSEIYLRSYANGRWGAETALGDSRRPARANDWSPAVTVAPNGNVYVAWDGYARGAYNIYMREIRAGQPGPLLEVTSSNRFHAHPSLAADARNRVWIAWDEGPENWGKDTGFLLAGGTGLYEARTVRVAVYANGQWMAPLRQPEDVVPYSYRRYFHSPRLACDTTGRVWLAARPRTASKLPTSLWAAGGKWEVAVTEYSGDRWSELSILPESVGRNEGELQLAPGANGAMYAAWVTDQRLFGGPNFAAFPRNNEILAAKLDAPAGPAPALAPRTAEPPAGLPSEPREREQLAALRSHAIRANGKTYRVYRGDMHRHTDISMDGAGDGSLWDAYRYAMDAANMDYFVVTDHQSGQQEYTWWRIDKSADMFHVPGFFTALYGTERSLSYPNGHRNLVFAKRGVPILPITPEEQKSSTGPRLYPYLRQWNGIATSHTSHTNMGTDWRDNDPALEPVVEIFQGARTSAEHEGAPLSPTGKHSELHAGGDRPLGYVWYAWQKGYKLGVQASSDHVSTHTSYACVIAENASRETLLDALRARHTYAATSNILMDYKLTAGGATGLQGDAVKSASLPEIAASIRGTGPLDKVVVVRDNQYVYSQEPQGDSFELRFKETSLTPGEHYYYVRVRQKDGNMAWSSPVWIDYGR